MTLEEVAKELEQAHADAASCMVAKVDHERLCQWLTAVCFAAKQHAALVADRDNWRKQALEEDAKNEAVMAKVRAFQNATVDREATSKADRDAFAKCTEALKGLMSL